MMKCIHGYSMAYACDKCAEDAALQAKPYQAADKVEAIEFAEIPRTWPEAEGKPAIDAENSMAVATRELAESIAHLAPAVSALAAAYAGSSPKSAVLLQAEACGFKSATGAPAGEGANATEITYPTRGPLTDHEFSSFCELVGYVAVEKQPVVRETINALFKWRGIL